MWLTKDRAARYLHIRKERLIRLINEGAVPAYEHPTSKGVLLVSTDDLDEFVRSRPARLHPVAAERRREAE